MLCVMFDSSSEEIEIVNHNRGERGGREKVGSAKETRRAQFEARLPRKVVYTHGAVVLAEIR